MANQELIEVLDDRTFNFFKIHVERVKKTRSQRQTREIEYRLSHPDDNVPRYKVSENPKK